MNKLKIGIVGAGRIGNVHAESITYHIPEAEVVMVTDVMEASAKKLAERFGALLAVEERIIGLHAGVVRLLVQRGVVARDDAGAVEGVDMAGTAGPRHLKARDGDDLRLHRNRD